MCDPISFVQDQEGSIYHCHAGVWPSGGFNGHWVHAERPESIYDCDSHSGIAIVHDLDSYDDELVIQIACYEIDIRTGECWYNGDDFDNEDIVELRIAEAEAWVASLNITSAATRQKLALERTESGVVTEAARHALVALWNSHQPWHEVWTADVTKMPSLSMLELATLAIGHPSEDVAVAATNGLAHEYYRPNRLIFHAIVARSQHKAVRNTVLRWHSHKSLWMRHYMKDHNISLD